MKFALGVKRAFAVLMVIVLVSSGLGIGPARVHAAASTVVLVGDLQSKFTGLATAETKDWNEKSTVTEMTYSGEGLYTFTGTLPKGTYQYKVALNDAWTENYGYGSYTDANGVNAGGNIQISLSEETSVTFYYNDNTKAIADSTYYTLLPENRLPRVTGSLQIALGDEHNDSPADARTLLADPDLDGVYEKTALLPAGDYSYQIYLPGVDPAGGISYPAAAQELNLPSGLPVTFKYHAQDNSVSAQYTVPSEPGTAVPVPAGHMRVHYHRAAGDYAGQALWTWGDYVSPSVNWPKDAVPSRKDKPMPTALMSICLSRKGPRRFPSLWLTGLPE